MDESRPPLTRTHPGPPAPSTSQASPLARIRTTTGMASSSQFNPAHQVRGDRVPQGIHAPRTHAHGDPPGSSALPNTPLANARVLASAVLSNLPPCPPTPHGNSAPQRHVHADLFPSDTGSTAGTIGPLPSRGHHATVQATAPSHH